MRNCLANVEPREPRRHGELLTMRDSDDAGLNVGGHVVDGCGTLNGNVVARNRTSGLKRNGALHRPVQQYKEKLDKHYGSHRNKECRKHPKRTLNGPRRQRSVRCRKGEVECPKRSRSMGNGTES